MIYFEIYNQSNSFVVIMILQVKIYLIATLYFFGALFILLFPPRNYVMYDKYATNYMTLIVPIDT